MRKLVDFTVFFLMPTSHNGIKNADPTYMIIHAYVLLKMKRIWENTHEKVNENVEIRVPEKQQMAK